MNHTQRILALLGQHGPQTRGAIGFYLCLSARLLRSLLADLQRDGHIREWQVESWLHGRAHGKPFKWAKTFTVYGVNT